MLRVGLRKLDGLAKVFEQNFRRRAAGGRNVTANTGLVRPAGDSLLAERRVIASVVDLGVSLRAIVTSGGIRFKEDDPRGDGLTVERYGALDVIQRAIAAAATGDVLQLQSMHPTVRSSHCQNFTYQRGH